MTPRTSYITAVCALVLSAVAAAQFGGPPAYDLSWNTIDGGGGTSLGGSFELSGTIGQHDAGVAMTGGGFSLTGGFWAGGGEPEVDTCPADIAPLPGGDGMVNVTDLLALIGQWGACPLPCPPSCPADLSGDCTVNVTDMLALIGDWGLCPP